MLTNKFSFSPSFFSLTFLHFFWESKFITYWVDFNNGLHNNWFDCRHNGNITVNTTHIFSSFRNPTLFALQTNTSNKYRCFQYDKYIIPNDSPQPTTTKKKRSIVLYSYHREHWQRRHTFCFNVRDHYNYNVCNIGPAVRPSTTIQYTTSNAPDMDHILKISHMLGMWQISPYQLAILFILIVASVYYKIKRYVLWIPTLHLLSFLDIFLLWHNLKAPILEHWEKKSFFRSKVLSHKRVCDMRQEGMTYWRTGMTFEKERRAKKLAIFEWKRKKYTECSIQLNLRNCLHFVVLSVWLIVKLTYQRESVYCRHTIYIVEPNMSSSEKREKKTTRARAQDINKNKFYGDMFQLNFHYSAWNFVIYLRLQQNAEKNSEKMDYYCYDAAFIPHVTFPLICVSYILFLVPFPFAYWTAKREKK